MKKIVNILFLFLISINLYSFNDEWNSIFSGVDYKEEILIDKKPVADDHIRIHIIRVDLKEKGLKWLVTNQWIR